jgi:hypothetical protein
MFSFINTVFGQSEQALCRSYFINLFLLVPDAGPVITDISPLGSDMMKITWSPVPVRQRHGIIKGYRIFYKAGLDGKWSKWQSHTVGPGNVTSGVVAGLISPAFYCFKMSAFTSKGQNSLWMTTPCWLEKSKLTNNFAFFHST